MKKLLFATHNKGKLHDCKEILGELHFTVRSLEDLNITQKAEETSATFAENSLLKAKFYANLSGILTLADDGGLEIPILNNLPGVHTRRWESDETLTDKQLIDKILEKLKGYQNEKRQAFLKTVITIYNPSNGEHIQTTGQIEGRITESLEMEVVPGYPIRSIFYVPQAGKIFGQFNKTDKLKYNHRRQAINNIKSELINLK